jgi:hypothetical protein
MSDDSHWGSSSLRGGLVAALGAAALMASLIALFAWSPWEEPTEVEWLGTYRAWSDGIESALGTGFEMPRAMCESTYDDEVGDPPTERLDPVSSAARRGCARLSAAGWREAEEDVVRALMSVHDELVPPRQRRDLAELAGSSVGVQPTAYCWSPESWAPFAEHYALVRGGEEVSLRGVADTARRRIDLDPGVCAALHRYLHRIRPIPLSYQNLELAQSLAVLTHQAERLRAPLASEADLECYAVQHVRPLVRAAWGRAFAAEIARHAWELSYTRLPPQFRTSACRDGGPLDRHPASSAWP